MEYSAAMIRAEKPVKSGIKGLTGLFIAYLLAVIFLSVMLLVLQTAEGIFDSQIIPYIAAIQPVVYFALVFMILKRQPVFKPIYFISAAAFTIPILFTGNFNLFWFYFEINAAWVLYLNESKRVSAMFPLPVPGFNEWGTVNGELMLLNKLLSQGIIGHSEYTQKRLELLSQPHGNIKAKAMPQTGLKNLGIFMLGAGTVIWVTVYALLCIGYYVNSGLVICGLSSAICLIGLVIEISVLVCFFAKKRAYRALFIISRIIFILFALAVIDLYMLFAALCSAGVWITYLYVSERVAERFSYGKNTKAADPSAFVHAPAMQAYAPPRQVQALLRAEQSLIPAVKIQAQQLNAYVPRVKPDYLRQISDFCTLRNRGVVSEKFFIAKKTELINLISDYYN